MPMKCKYANESVYITYLMEIVVFAPSIMIYEIFAVEMCIVRYPPFVLLAL